MELAITPVRSHHGTSFCAFLRDITERKRMEAQSLQTQKMESLGQLAGGIAHDFNNMLCGIIGYADLALSQLAEDDPNRENFEYILNAGHRASGLTKQILTFSRQGISEPEPTDVTAILANVSEMLRHTLRKDITLIVRCPSEPAFVMANTVNLEQVLLNFVINAADAIAGQGTITVEVTSYNRSHSTPHQIDRNAMSEVVAIKVSDTGSGIAPEIRAKIFDPFFTTKPVGKGTGLGLATVYGIVKTFGGQIHLDSELGSGTTFTVYFAQVSSDAAISSTPPVVALPGRCPMNPGN